MVSFDPIFVLVTVPCAVAALGFSLSCFALYRLKLGKSHWWIALAGFALIAIAYVYLGLGYVAVYPLVEPEAPTRYSLERLAFSTIAAIAVLAAFRVYRKRAFNLWPFRISLKELLALVALVAIQLAFQEVFAAIASANATAFLDYMFPIEP